MIPHKVCDDPLWSSSGQFMIRLLKATAQCQSAWSVWLSISATTASFPQVFRGFNDKRARRIKSTLTLLSLVMFPD